MLTRLTLIIALVALCLAGPALAQDADDAGDSGPLPLSVWLPADLISDEAGAAFQLLSAQGSAFDSENDIAVQFRIKATEGPGGIMSTIRAGKDVAPAALPDMTLIHRRDLTPAQASAYLQSLETLFSASLLNDLSSDLSFGQVTLEGEPTLFGLPYLFDMLIGVHRQPLQRAGERLSFADVLASDASFLFPAARANGLNQTFYHQYLAAGGAKPTEGMMEIDEDALRKALAFYEALVQRELVSPDVLTWQSPSAYINEFVNRDDGPQLALLTVNDFLSLVEAADATFTASEIPTADANGSAVLDGWLWVLVTPERNRQTLAARFIEWLMEPAFHAGLARTLRLLPSQPGILAESLPDGVDAAVFAALLAGAELPLPEGDGGAAPRLMQEALVDVLHGEASAEAATEQAISALAER